MPVNGFCQFPSLKAAMAAFPEAWRSTGRGNGYELVVRAICEPGKGLAGVNGWPGPPSRPIAAMAQL